MFKALLFFSIVVSAIDNYADRLETPYNEKFNTQYLFIDSVKHNKRDITYYCSNGNPNYYFKFNDRNLIIADSIYFDDDLFCRTKIYKK